MVEPNYMAEQRVSPEGFQRQTEIHMYMQEGTTEGGVVEGGRQERKESKWGLEKSGEVLQC